MPLLKLWAGSLVMLAAVSLPLQAASPVKVGSKIDTEGALLGNIILQVLESHGVPTVNKVQLGTTPVVRGAITSGELDIYPEYTGNGAFFFKDENDAAWKNAQQGYEKVKKLDSEHNKLIWLTPAPANNTWTIAVRQDVAEKNKLTSLADLSRYLQEGGTFKLAASAEFIERADALPAFEKAYGFKLGQDQLLSLAGGDTAVTIKAAAQQTSGVNAAMAYGTDGPVAALGLQTLSDPQGVQPIYAPAPVVRESVLREYPQMAQWLQPVFASLDAKTLQQLNASIAVEGLDAKKVAADYLKQKVWAKYFPVTYLRINPVLALLLLLTAIAAALPFISYAPNRLVSGEGRHLWQLWPQTIWMLVGVGCAWLTACFIPGKKGSICALILAQFVFVLLVWGAGKAATQLAQNGSALARTSLGSGFWLAAALALLACSDAIRRISTHPLWRWLLHMQIAIIPLWLLYSGTLNDLSLMKEYANRQDVFDDALAQHLTLLFGAVLPALVIGVPLGIWCYFSTARQGAIFSLLNVIQTVPSVALFGLLIAPLAALVTAFPWLGTLGIAGTGMTPALIALVLYALLPLVRGVVVGLNQIPRDVLESARAMGMSGAQRFLHVQLPLALPVFLRSLRVVMVQTVGMAVIAALIGAGGFGALVFQGLLSSAIDLVLLGVIPVIVLAVLTDALFDLLIALLKVKRND